MGYFSRLVLEVQKLKEENKKLKKKLNIEGE